ncbi:MAG TPA: hypothetical protein VFY18_01880 [Candidatus Limnocylindrales bacterium]|nr:hypothetical protein [Candidatus Limnocylindrales bacterium]
MRKIGTISLVAVSALALAAGVSRASTPVAAQPIELVREIQAGDDRGGQRLGSDDAIVTNRELEIGDDKGGATSTAEPGDDKGGATSTPEPGDDNGGDDQHGGHGSDG